LAASVGFMPTISPKHSKLLRVTHFLSVKAKVSGGGDLKVRLPVTLCSFAHSCGQRAKRSRESSPAKHPANTTHEEHHRHHHSGNEKADGKQVKPFSNTDCPDPSPRAEACDGLLIDLVDWSAHPVSSKCEPANTRLLHFFE